VNTCCPVSNATGILLWSRAFAPAKYPPFRPGLEPDITSGVRNGWRWLTVHHATDGFAATADVASRRAHQQARCGLDVFPLVGRGQITIGDP
jgi:hypothetical protein